MNTSIPIFISLFGAIVGSFLNVVIDRLPINKSIVTPPSHCDHCQKKLSSDLVKAGKPPYIAFTGLF